MAIEVRCACGQLVYADAALVGQHVQCPHCKASVAVPVATASAAPPPTPPDAPKAAPLLDWPTRQAIQVGIGVLLMAGFLAVAKGCKEDAKDRPTIQDRLKESRTKDR